MTASVLLADLCQKGVVLRLSEDRLRILVPSEDLTPDLRQALLAVKSEVLRLLVLSEQYKSLLDHAFAMPAPDCDDSGDAQRQFADEQARLMDELGPALAAAIFETESREWRAATGMCPRCGDADNCHDEEWWNDQE